MPRKQLTPPAPRDSHLRRSARWILGGLLIVVAALVIRAAGPQIASAKGPAFPFIKRQAAAAPQPSAQGNPQNAASAPAKPQVVAVINGEQITREELGRECLRHYGTEVIESLVNKHLIADRCKQRGITVTNKEVDAEIDRMARKFALPKDQWLKMLEKERGIKAAQYANDIVWPSLALRKLAESKLQVTRQELDEAYESQFGPAVKARLIVVGDRHSAERVRAQAVARPEEFGPLAKKYSQDVNSASANGMIQPIRRHVGDKEIERVAFSLRKGDISPVLPVGNQWVIFKCEGHLEATRPNRAQVDPMLEEAIRDRKLRAAAGEVFRDLQKHATVENVFNDPAKSRQLPGVAALINDRKVLIHELAEECIERHGVEVLEGTLNHRLLEQALRKKGLTVTQADLDAEVARAAATMGKTDRAGKPDVKLWLDTVTKQQNITVEIYMRDSVWPSVALKKLVGGRVAIEERDLQKSFEANYGPRVRCRAIVVNSQRKAQEVWEKARNNETSKNPDPKFFGDLAEQYSVEASSRSLRGEVPPIQRHGGQPVLEREAFELRPGELSGVIQVGENFVVLRCEGRTEPMNVRFEEVRQLLYEDIHEKKLRITMAKHFEQLQDAAHIDNYLAGTLKAPKKAQQVALDPRAARPGAAVRK